jgi:hypothetical protein
VDKAIQYLNTTETERQRRAAIQFGPAQFRLGGFVSPSLATFGALPSLPSALHFGSGGVVPAILHPGEYVIRSEAVNRMGMPALDRINRGDVGGDAHYHGPVYNIDKINALDAKSVLELFATMKNEGWRKLI